MNISEKTFLTKEQQIAFLDQKKAIFWSKSSSPLPKIFLSDIGAPLPLYGKISQIVFTTFPKVRNLHNWITIVRGGHPLGQ